MKKSEAAIGFVCYGKAAKLDIDPLLFSSTMHYILTHPKPLYGGHDIVQAEESFLQTIADHLRVSAASMKPIFSALNAKDYHTTALQHFADRHSTPDFLNYIFAHCRSELKAVIDYIEMLDAGFAEEEVITRIERYA